MSSDNKYPAAELIAAVQQSPILVAKHDRDGWCSLYATDGQVNDPVGSQPHNGRAAIERFYDTFIAPNTIIFHVNQDIACGMSVMRDLTVETVMSTGVQMFVPMHLRYDLVEQGGKLKIRRLYAHWELMPMIIQLMTRGLKGLWTSIKLGPQLIANQGIGGVIGFMKGFAGVGRAGKRTAQEFLDALSRGDLEAAKARLTASASLELPMGTMQTITELSGRLRGLKTGKTLVAGRTVTATFSIDKGTRGVVLFRFKGSARAIDDVQVFV